jgi:hypothetical protein
MPDHRHASDDTADLIPGLSDAMPDGQAVAADLAQVFRLVLDDVEVESE